MNFSICATCIVEVKEYLKLIESYQDSINNNLTISQIFFLTDPNNERAIRELKITNLSIATGYSDNGTFISKLSSFSNSDNYNKQILFLRNNKIKYRNKISSSSIVPIETKKRVLNTGLFYANHN